MQSTQESIKKEKEELDEKREALVELVNSDAGNALDSSEKSRIREQHAAMTRYSDILGERLTVF